MKVTIRSAKMDKAGRHNDRNFDIESSEHIDKNRVRLNRYYTYNGEENMSFLELEQAFYKEHFSDYVNAQNERNTKAGHKERNQTIEEYYYNRKTRPEDVILQIGDKDEHATIDELWSCALKYKDKFNEMFGDHCKILDMALHDDEMTPHVHIRRVWLTQDKRGDECVNNTKCLRDMEMLLPDESKAVDRFNNLKMSFSRMDREMFIDICEEEGFEIERTADSRRKHLSVEEFKNMKDSQLDLDGFQRNLDMILQIAIQNEMLYEKHKKELEEIEKKSLNEKMEIFHKLAPEIQSAILLPDMSFDHQAEVARLRSEIKKRDKKIRNYETFLDSKELLDEYKNTEENKSKINTENDKNNPVFTAPTESFF